MYMAVDQVGWQSAVYFVALVLIGNFLLFNLFLAILLATFESDEEDLMDEEEEMALQEEAAAKLTLGSSGRGLTMNSNRLDSQNSFDDSDKAMKTKAMMHKKTTPEDRDDSPDIHTPKSDDIDKVG